MTSKTQDNHSVAINLIQKSSALLHLAWQDGEDFLQEDRGGDGTDGEDGEDADAREEEPVNDVRSRRHGLPYKAASLDVCWDFVCLGNKRKKLMKKIALLKQLKSERFRAQKRQQQTAAASQRRQAKKLVLDVQLPWQCLVFLEGASIKHWPCSTTLVDMSQRQNYPNVVLTGVLHAASDRFFFLNNVICVPRKTIGDVGDVLKTIPLRLRLALCCHSFSWFMSRIIWI